MSRLLLQGTHFQRIATDRSLKRRVGCSALLTGTGLLLLTGCTGSGAQTVTTPAPTVTLTVTASPSPAIEATKTAPAEAAVLQPQLNDIADLAYRSGMAAPTTQFNVPAGGYEILYLCRNDGLLKGRADQGTAGLHATGAGAPSDTALRCDNTIHTITVDAATVRKTGRAETIRKITLTGDKQDVLGIDLSVRKLR